MAMRSDLKNLVVKAIKKDALALARVISKIENRDRDYPELFSFFFKQAGHSKLIGITGPPGAGKSTFINALIKEYRKMNHSVGIVCVDPSSPFSGGAVLGDRIRMQEHDQDKGVMIRSLGTRGNHGGLSQATRDVAMVLDACGFDRVIIETAGVGQTDLNILEVAETIVVVLVPESGDSIQVMKAGLMEIADIFLVNKSDRPMADRLVKELFEMVSLSEGRAPVAVIKTESHVGKGITEALKAIEAHPGRNPDQRVIGQVLEILTNMISKSAVNFLKNAEGRRIVKKIMQRAIDPYSVTIRYKKKLLR